MKRGLFREPQPQTNNYRQLRNVERRNSVPREEPRKCSVLKPYTYKYHSKEPASAVIALGFLTKHIMSSDSASSGHQGIFAVMKPK